MASPDGGPGAASRVTSAVVMATGEPQVGPCPLRPSFIGLGLGLLPFLLAPLAARGGFPCGVETMAGGDGKVKPRCL